MKLVTYKIIPITKKLYCDCGQELTYEHTKQENELTEDRQFITHKMYICPKCGQVHEVEKYVNTNNMEYILGGVLEDVEYNNK